MEDITARHEEKTLATLNMRVFYKQIDAVKIMTRKETFTQDKEAHSYLTVFQSHIRHVGKSGSSITILLVFRETLALYESFVSFGELFRIC